MQIPPALIWQSRRLARSLGLTGISGLVGLLVAVSITVGGILPLQRELTGLRLALASAPATTAAAKPVAPPETTLAAELATFMARFPAVEQLSTQLDTLFALCDDQGLAVDKGEYALVEKAGGPLRRFEVTLPVVGSYPQVITLLADVLEQLPAAAVTDISVEREKIADGRIRANLRLVFFVRKAGK